MFPNAVFDNKISVNNDDVNGVGMKALVMTDTTFNHLKYVINLVNSKRMH